MGQNMVGWIRVKMSGKKGDRVQIKYAEVLDKDGNFYTANLRSAECTDTYVFAETGTIEYEPSFTFHGFRFVQFIGRITSYNVCYTKLLRTMVSPLF